MKKILAACSVAASIPLNSLGSNISLKITNLKSDKVITKITVPIWVAKTGVHLSNIFGSNKSGVDVLSIIKEVEKKGFKKGPFLDIEDYAQSQKISLSIE